MTPTWAQLHAMEPGLRPVGFSVDMTHPDWWVYCECGATQVVVTEDVWNALCRDRAYEWLDSMLLTVRVQTRAAFGVLVGWELVSTSVRVGEESLWINVPSEPYPTRDEAYRAACALVIGARREQPPSASSPGTAPPATH